MKDSSTFTNPPSWNHEGPYVIELTDDAQPSERILSMVRKEGNRLHISDGVCHQGIGGIQHYSQGFPFVLLYNYMKAIRKVDGDLLWVNYNHR